MDPRLIIALVVGIAVIIFVVLKTRMDAFMGLLLASIVIGLISGQPLVAIMSSITTGFGNTLASIGIVIGLGIILGKVLEVSGAAQVIALGFLKLFGKGKEPWAMTSIGALISIPVFCDSGYVIMNPLARSIARLRQRGYAVLGIALAGGMVITHHFVPPTPGPLGVAGILGADVGSVILVGLVFTVFLIPVVTLYAKWVAPRAEAGINEKVYADVYGHPRADEAAAAAGTQQARTVAATRATEDPDLGPGPDGVDEPTLESERDANLGLDPDGLPAAPIGMFVSLAPLVVPLVLIVLNTALTAVDKSQQGALTGDYSPSEWVQPFAFIGHPVAALLIGAVLALYLLLPRWTPQAKTHRWLAEAASSAGLILLITGAGGGLGQVLRDSGIGTALADSVGSLPLPSFLLPFIVASIVRVAQGSGTVSMITAAGVTAPMMEVLGLSPVVGVMACVAGAMVASHFNDSYFWVVTRFLGIEGTTALRAHTGMTTVMWAASIPMLFVASLILG